MSPTLNLLLKKKRRGDGPQTREVFNWSSISVSGEGGGVEGGDGEQESILSTSLGTLHSLFGMAITPAHISMAFLHRCTDPVSDPVLSMLAAFHFSDASFRSSFHA